jgi:hypothetical protein
LSWEALSWAPVPRHAAALPLIWLTIFVSWSTWPRSAGAGNPIPSSLPLPIEEQLHEIELDASPEGATLVVTRSLFNPGPLPAQVELPIPLPCAAAIDQVEVQARDAGGALVWRPAELLGADEAASRWDAWVEGPLAGSKIVMDADTAVHMSRSEWGCEATLEVYPIPPMRSRTVSYRVFVPSVYDQGVHTIELPALSTYGRATSIEIDPASSDPEYELRVDGQPLPTTGSSLDTDREHLLEFTARDGGRGHVSAVDLDLSALVAAAPAALAALPVELPVAELPHVLLSNFEAPIELAQLPPVRRVVVVVDASRSVDDQARRQLVTLAGAYLEQLAPVGTSAPVQAEVLLFDRQVRRVYHDFVPASWVGQDLPKLEIADGNGSELELAIESARGLLERPTSADGADWIIVLSDLYLRHDFAVEASRLAAADATARIHVVRVNEHYAPSFGPGLGSDPWTAVARTAGGMLWDISARNLDEVAAATELISPARIWSLRLELQLEGGHHRDVELDPWLEAGTTREFADYEHRGPGLERAAFVGEVWGQRRAWTASPTDEAGRRAAASLAVDVEQGELNDAERTALAFHAQVVSPFTSAWTVAGFDGPAMPQPMGLGLGTISLGGRGYSSGCGGRGGHHIGWAPRNVSVESLVQAALSRCAVTTGSLEFETTDLEIVAVASPNRCVEQQTWEQDLSPTQISGRKRFTATYVDGVLTGLSTHEFDDPAA